MLPLWLEVVLLALVAYGAGLGIGWVLWARKDAQTARMRSRVDDRHD